MDLETAAPEVIATQSPSDPVPAPRLINLCAVEGAFIDGDGFSRPDWTRLTQEIERTVSPEEQGDAWNEVVFQWVERLQGELGGDYRIRYSPDFILLSNLHRDEARGLLGFAEKAMIEIRSRLGGLAWADTPARHVVLLFQEEDDYYDYVGGFEQGDVVPTSLGMHFGSGYPHVAIKHESDTQDAQTLVHELTHHCVTHLPIPVWLNEGVAQRLQRAIVGVYAPRAHEGASSHYWAAISNWVPPLMWDELVEKHHAFWNEQNIQEFWAGTSFNQSGDARELSYSLAEVLVHLLGEDREGFLAFLSRAHYDDAGQTAALDCLGINLGDAAGTFLGEGNWRPYRKAMVQCWDAQRQIPPEDPTRESSPPVHLPRPSAGNRGLGNGR